MNIFNLLWKLDPAVGRPVQGLLHTDGEILGLRPNELHTWLHSSGGVIGCDWRRYYVIYDNLRYLLCLAK